MRIGIWAAIIGLVVASPAMATRKLPVPGEKGWQHAQTGLVLMPTIAGLTRTQLEDFGNSELDIAAQFDDASGDTEATLYLFRPALDSVPMWFDRAVTTLGNHDIYGGVTPTGAPIAFARPGNAATDSLRQTFVPAKQPYTATALAVMPVGDWLMSIRLSGKTLAPAALDDLLTQFIADLRLATPVVAGPIAIPIAACTTAIRFRQAKLEKPDMTQVLLGATIATMTPDVAKVANEKPSQPPVWCRESAAANDYAVYRQNDGSLAYVMALADAGRTIGVSSSIAAILGKKGFSVTFNDLDKSLIYPSYNALPQPAQVFDMVRHQAPLSSTSGKNITISTQD